MHVVLTAREITCESKGTKHIQVLGVENKKQVITMASLTIDSNCFPLKWYL